MYWSRMYRLISLIRFAHEWDHLQIWCLDGCLDHSMLDAGHKCLLTMNDTTSTTQRSHCATALTDILNRFGDLVWVELRGCTVVVWEQQSCMQHMPKCHREQIGLIGSSLHLLLCFWWECHLVGYVLYTGYWFYKTKNTMKCHISFKGYMLYFSGCTHKYRSRLL